MLGFVLLSECREWSAAAFAVKGSTAREPRYWRGRRFCFSSETQLGIEHSLPALVARLNQLYYLGLSRFSFALPSEYNLIYLYSSYDKM